jgi:hypothetical protein
LKHTVLMHYIHYIHTRCSYTILIHYTHALYSCTILDYSVCSMTIVYEHCV